MKRNGSGAKRLLLCGAAALLLAMPAHADGVALDAAAFPDPVFREALAQFDADGDGSLSRKELASVEVLRLSGTKVADLTGVELLTELESLDVDDCELTRLDLSANTELEYLDCDNNAELTELIVPRGIETLWAYNTMIVEMDLSGCEELQNVSLNNSKLESIDLTGCSRLESLSVDECKLTELNVLDCGRLEELECAGNRLTELDLSAQTRLTWLDCTDNRLETLQVNHNPELTVIMCSGNRLKELDLSGMEKLDWIAIYDNDIESIDVTGTGMAEDDVIADDECEIIGAEGGSIGGSSGSLRRVVMILRVILGAVALVGAFVWLLRRRK